MFLNQNLQLLVFEINENNFDNIGEVNQITSLSWPDKFNGFDNFELKVPINDDNKYLLVKNNILWTGKDNACIIEIIDSIVDEFNDGFMIVKGRTLESILTNRIIWSTYNTNGKKVSQIMYDIVNENCINPENELRKIPFLVIENNEEYGNIISYQRTGGEVYLALQDLAFENNLGFDIEFRPFEKKIVFKVLPMLDKTLNQTDLIPIVFDTNFEDVLSSEFYSNSQSLKTVALIAGEDSGVNRKRAISGNDLSSGFLRREVYIDARDLKSEIRNSDGTTTSLTSQEYENVLIQRGNEKLSNFITFENFQTKVKVLGNVQYVYGQDYFKGDRITVIDRKIGIQANVVISRVEEVWGENYSIFLTFGNEYPTLIKKITTQYL